MKRVVDLVSAGLLVCAVLGASAARAELITDAAGDLLATFVPGDAATHDDVDVTSTEVILNTITNEFTFTATHVGDIGSSINIAGAPGAVYVWGLDRGQGTERLAAIVNNVFFDSVVVLNADNTGAFVDLISGAAPVPLAAGAVTSSGGTITGVISTSLIPALAGGFAIEDWTWNLWPRFIFDPAGGAIFTDPAVSDFAPDARNAALTVVGDAVPEPSVLALLALGLVALTLRRRR